MRAHRSVTIPDPSLVVLIGAAGAGKSTFAARHFEPAAILSSDAFRERISGDPADQTVTGAAFAALHRAVTRRLTDARLTVVDATNVLPRARRSLLRRAAAAGVPAVAIVLELPDAIVLDRNAGRAGRRVPPDVVVHQLADLRRSLVGGGLLREGFATVVRLRSPDEVLAVRIIRAPA
jgi:protein phosphatase